MFLAVVASSGSQKFGVSPVRFKWCENRLERSSATPISDPSKFHFFVSLQTTEPLKVVGRFPLCGRFRAERTSRAVGNLAVSVSNAPFSHRNSFSSRFFGRKRILNSTFRRILKCSFSCSKNLPQRTFTILKVISREVL